MTDCHEWLDDLTYTADRILDEDLAGLKRMSDRSRIERYNGIKADEEEFNWEFREDCGGFLTDAEADRVRGDLRLARLLLAASFHAEGDLPRAMESDFIDAELQAVVDFDRYKQFDVLDEEQIEGRIRRMEGEVYELVREYTATQIADMDALIDNPEVQGDVIERLVDRYEDRRERIRHGLFVYIETHGMEHMVDSIESAVEAVADSAADRADVRERLRAELDDVEASVERDFERRRRSVEAELRRTERELASGAADPDALDGVDGLGEDAVAELREAIERTERLEERLEANVDRLEDAKRNAEASDSDAGEETAEVVASEMEALESQREEVRGEVEQLRRERERIESARERLEERQDELESQVDSIQESVESADAGIDGASVVTAATAKLFEMDYVGRFDTTLHEIERIELPDGDVELPDGYWEGRSQRRSEAPTMVQLLEDDPGERVGSYPTNPTARYEITERRYLGLSEETEMIIEATVRSDLEAYAANGFDSTPAGVDDLLEIVNDAVREADRRDVRYLLGIASPTGWTDRVKSQIESDDLARTQYSRRVSVCLVDLRDGSLVYDDSDPVVADNIGLFDRAVAAERVEECLETIRSEYAADIARETVGLEEVAERGFDRHVVKQAFERLEADGDAEQFYVDGDGLAVDLS